MGKNRGKDGLLNLDDFLPDFWKYCCEKAKSSLPCYKMSCYCLINIVDSPKKEKKKTHNDHCLVTVGIN